MRRSRRRRSTSSCVSPGPRVPMPAPCWLSCGAAAAQARQPVAQLRELDLHRAFLARRVLGEDVEDQRDAVDDVDREQLLEVALLRGRELVVEDHDVDVERVAELAAAPRPCPCRCRSPGRACARRCSTRSTGSAPAVSARSASSSSDASASSTRRRCRTPVPTSSARWRTPLEVDLGRGEAAALPVLVRAATDSWHNTRSASIGTSTSNTCTTGPPSRTVSPSATCSVAAGHVDLHARADEAAPVRDRGGRARAGAARQRLARAPLPDPHGDPVGAGDARRTRRSCGAGSAASCSMSGPCVGDAALRPGSSTKQHEVRIADAGRVAAVDHAVGDAFELERIVDRDRDLRGLERDRAHVDVGGDDLAAGVALEPHAPPARRGVDDRARRPGPSPARAATHARQRMPLPLISAAPAVGVHAASSCSRRRRARARS